MKSIGDIDVVALVQAERAHIEEVIQAAFDAPDLSILEVTAAQLPGINGQGVRALRTLQSVCRSVEEGRAVDAELIPRFLQSGEVLTEQLCSGQETVLDYTIQALSAIGGGNGLWTMAAKAAAISGIYTVVSQVESHFGPMSPITRTVGGLSALLFAVLWTELLYHAVRTANEITNAQWKGCCTTAAGGIFALVASANNVFLLHPWGLAVAVCGSISALGLWVSLYVADLRQRYGDPLES